MRHDFVLDVLLFLIVIVLTNSKYSTAIPVVNLELATDGSSYSVWVNDQSWLQSSTTWFRAKNRVYSTADGSLKFVTYTTDSGVDTVGEYNVQSITWIAEGTDGLFFQTNFRQYWNLFQVDDGADADPSNTRAIVFEQVWLNTTTGSSSGNPDFTISAFPAFVASNQSAVDLGYVAFYGNFLNHTYGVFSGENADFQIVSGLDSGPVFLFDKSANVTATIAPFNSFTSTSVVSYGPDVFWGYLGAIDSIRAGSTIEVMIYFGDEGLRQNVLRWGDVFTGAYGKRRSDSKTETIVQYLGYSTDRGAYYYTKPEKNTTFEETFLLLKAYTDSLDIPYQFMSIGSFWYFKNSSEPMGGGTLNWTAMPSVFPHGLQTFHENMHVPIMAHNRWFDISTSYAKANGGLYDFIFSGNWAVPVTVDFWSDLFGNSTWGVRMYIQDWLITHTHSVEQFQSVQDLQRTWLVQMGIGAARHGVNIQYCMPLPRHVLQSVEIPNVVQVRASEDYLPGNSQWVIGTSSIIDYAVGLIPFKDNFWTTEVQPDNMYNSTEPASALEAYVALASTGSVAPSDRIGYANATLIMQTCRADGKLLKPDVPAMDLDSTFAYRVWKSGGPSGVVTHTYTELAGYRWHSVLSSGVLDAYKLTYSELGLSATANADGFVVVRMYQRYLDLSSLSVFDDSNPIVLPESAEKDFSVFYLAPVPTNQIVFLGEVDKLMLVSRVRVPEIRYTSESVLVHLSGSPGELVTFAWTLAPYRTAQQIKCTIDDGGSGLLVLSFSGASC